MWRRLYKRWKARKCVVIPSVSISPSTFSSDQFLHFSYSPLRPLSAFSLFASSSSLISYPDPWMSYAHARRSRFDFVGHARKTSKGLGTNLALPIRHLVWSATSSPGPSAGWARQIILVHTELSRAVISTHLLSRGQTVMRVNESRWESELSSTIEALYRL